ncbi:MAG: NADH-quinone oxidoreductase subunit NuoN [Neisseriaceae bacterium]
MMDLWSNLSAFEGLSSKWLVLFPDIILLVWLGLVLLVDLFAIKTWRSLTEKTTLLGLVVVFCAQLLLTMVQARYGKPIFAFEHTVVNDSLANISKLLIYSLTFLVLIFSRQYLKQKALYRGEFYLLTLFAVLGANVMVSSSNYVLLFIGLELLSLALYAIIALQRESLLATEAALKYFVLGSLASGILLFGISMVYGATGSLDISQVLQTTQAGDFSRHILLLLGVVFVVVGITFKFGAAPFHMWVPDVYEGAPTPVALLVGSTPKIAIVIFAYRILSQSLGAYSADWGGMLQGLAILSLLVGNIAAVLQTNVKRMLGYSTVAHMGFVLLGLSAHAANTKILAGVSDVGAYSALFYMITYMSMVLVAFGILIALSTKENDCANLSDLSGLNNRHPILAFLMLLAMFSMAGIPPLVGFYSKFYVIKAMLALGWLKLSIFSVLMSLIGAFYYLRIVKVMYFEANERSDRSALTLDFSLSGKVFLVLTSLSLLVLGIYPEPIAKVCQYLFQFS